MRRFLPRGSELADHGLLLVLGVLGLLGLRPTYTGWQYLLVGTLGILLGLTCVRVAWWRRWPAVAGVLLALAIFILLGGPLCLRATGEWLPAGPGLGDLLDTVILGWKELLTTLPPVDGSGHLLVLPWLLGMVTGTLGGVLLAVAGRMTEWARVGPPLLAPVLLLAAVILVGVRRPASLLLQGVAFGVVALVWLVVRGLDRTTVQSARRVGTLRRAGLGAVLLALAGAIAVPASAALTDDGRRQVLRAKVVPPVDITQYGSPLSSFRRYVADPHAGRLNLNKLTLMTVAGAPAGSRIRFATLDTYDGTVWGASEEPANALPGVKANAFLRVSNTIDNPVKGRRAHVTVTLGDGWTGTSAVWLPTVGALQTLRFAGGDAEELAGQVRYDLATSTGLVPGGLRAGDRYRFTTVLPNDSFTADTRLSTAVDPDLQQAAAFVEEKARAWAGSTTDHAAQILHLADALKTKGYYSDGVAKDERMYHAGHYQKRLGHDFVDADLIVGDDEQYAAAMALMANRLGVPARVVLGAEVPSGGVVRGSDVHAWVELQAADGTWRTLPTDSFMSRKKPAQLPPQQTQRSKGSEAPPPAPVPPPSSLDRQDDRELKAKKDADTTEGSSGPGVPRWVKLVAVAAGGPLLVLLLLVAAITGAKGWRRSRRRRAERPSARVAGGWRELVDHARDLGLRIPIRGLTRREQARLLDRAEESAHRSGGGAETSGRRSRPVSDRTRVARAPALARTADGHVFGPLPPSDTEAAAYWAEVDAARRELSRGVGRRRRMWAAISPVTLRPTRWGRRTDRRNKGRDDVVARG